MKRIIGIIFLSVLLALGGGELLLRTLFQYPQPRFLKVDKVLGYRLRPNVEGWFTREGVSFVFTNGSGLRDKEYPVDKTDRVRIAVVGDSYTEAMQVNLEDSFHGLLEREYADHMEVLNFGVSGYGTAQELLVYKEHVRDYSPDVVVLAFDPGTDIRDNSKVLSSGCQRPYYVLENGRLRLDNRFLQSTMFTLDPLIYDIYYFLTDHFLIFSFLDRLRNSTDFILSPAKQKKELQIIQKGTLIYDPRTYEQINAWRVTEKLINRLAAEVKKDGAEFVLLVQDSLPGQIEQEEQRRYYVENRLGKLCEAHNYVCGFMGPIAIKYKKTTGIHLHGLNGSNSGHWNREGHKVAYGVLKKTLQKYGLLPTAGNVKTNIPAPGK
jgi:hypothetical protein